MFELLYSYYSKLDITDEIKQNNNMQVSEKLHNLWSLAKFSVGFLIHLSWGGNPGLYLPDIASS